MRFRHLTWPTFAVVVGLSCLRASDVSALVLDSSDSAVNIERPEIDPGWDHVGSRLGGPSVVYVGNGWVLTANHVGAGTVVFDGITYNPVPDSATHLRNEDDSLSDLLAFQIIDPPDLRLLPIAHTAPRLGEEVMMIGTGKSRGKNITLDVKDHGLVDGWKWDNDSVKRWGTNLVAGKSRYIGHAGTRTLAGATTFDRINDLNGTRQEAQAAVGDSGGALFAPADHYDRSKGWTLAGIMFSISNHPNQPKETSFYGDATFYIDLAHYREQIIPLVRPQCSNEIDDDDDGRIDFPADRSCETEGADDESLPTPPELSTILLGVGGLVAVAVSFVLLWRRNRSARASGTA